METFNSFVSNAFCLYRKRLLSDAKNSLSNHVGGEINIIVVAVVARDCLLCKSLNMVFVMRLIQYSIRTEETEM